MTTHEQPLQHTSMVIVRLTGLGRHLLQNDRSRAVSLYAEDSEPDRGPNFARAEVTMQLWELMRIFGPHMTSSPASTLPFLSIKAQLPETSVVEKLREQLVIARENRTESEERANHLRIAVDKLARRLDCGDTRYCSPEELDRRLAEHLETEVARVPDRPGAWWHGHGVVEVRWDVKRSHTLVVKRANGRRTPADKMPDAWRGPARHDPRVEPPPCMPEGDEDIPF